MKHTERLRLTPRLITGCNPLRATSLALVSVTAFNSSPRRRVLRRIRTKNRMSKTKKSPKEVAKQTSGCSRIPTLPFLYGAPLISTPYPLNFLTDRCALPAVAEKGTQNATPEDALQ